MRKVSKVALIWKLAILSLIIHSMISVGTYWLGAMNGQEWSDLTNSQKIAMEIGMWLNFLGYVSAWLDKSIARVSKDDAPLPPGVGDTEEFRKSQTV